MFGLGQTHARVYAKYKQSGANGPRFVCFTSLDNRH